jgi:hypothetical protein
VHWRYQLEQEFNMQQVKVNGTPFTRDVGSKALMNNDVNARNDYYNRLQQLKLQKEEINTVKDEVQCIKNDVVEIKYLLQKLLEGSNGTTNV